MDYQRSRSPSVRSNKDRPQTQQPQASNKVYVSFLPSDVQQGDLKNLFSQCGEVTSIYIKKKDDGFTFAYIEYSQISEAEKATEKLNRRKMGQKNISVKFATKKPDNGKNNQKQGGNNKGNFENNGNSDKNKFGGKPNYDNNRNGGGGGDFKKNDNFRGNQSNRGDRGSDRPNRNNSEFKGGDNRNGGDRNNGDRNGGDRNNGDRNGGDRNGGDRNGGDRNGGGRNFNQGGERRPMKCFKCQGEGHMSKNCPQNDNNQSSGNNGSSNYNNNSKNYETETKANENVAADMDY